MKRLFFQISAVALLQVTFSFHCLGSDTYTLQLNLEKGHIYRQHLVTDMNVKTDAMGQETNVSLLSDMIMLFEVVEERDDAYKIKASYHRIKINTAVPGSSRVIVVDSDSPENSTSKKICDVFQTIIGMTMDIELTRQGKIKYIDGADRLAEKFNVITNEQQRQIFSKQFSENALTETLQNIIACFPDKPVAINESWDIALNVSFEEGAENTDAIHLTLKEVKGDIALLEDMSNYSVPRGNSSLHLQGMSAKVLAEGEENGIIYIDMKTGWITRSEITQTYKENIKLMGQSIVENYVIKTIVTTN